MAHYYEGETLKERITRGPLELNDAIDIATQVGEGLAKAHAAGIVHRDIKPANLMVTTDGTVKILDFGLAKLAGSEGVTQTGTTVGTVAYMSPEQAKGQQVDHRTDIWSLGVLLYEMLAGTPPFKGENLLSLSNAIMDGEPMALSGSSASAQTIVGRALIKDRTQRFQAVAALLTELGALQSGSDAATAATPTKADVPSIAVLPFRNMSTDPEQEYFCEGLAEELIDALARLEGLRVAARTSAFQFGGKGHDLSEIGEKLRVKTILEGSVRRAGNRLRVNAQLINATDGYHLWSERYDRTMDDVFELQDEITQAVVERLKVELLGEADAPVTKRPTDNIEAYNLVLEGRYHHARASGADLQTALDCYTRALALEPNYAQAHARVAQVQGSRAALSFESPRTLMPQAKASALKALAIDETLGDAHSALAFVLDFYEWDRAGAEAEYRRALELSPGDTAFARGFFAQMLYQSGRSDEAIREARRVVDLDPLSLLGRYFLSLVFGFARRFDEAIAEAHAALKLEPNYYLLQLAKGWGLAGQGQQGVAVEAFRQAAKLAPDDPLPQAYLGWGLGISGERSDGTPSAVGCGRDPVGSAV